MNFLQHLTLAQGVSIAAHFVLICSAAQNFLPPVEYLQDAEFSEHAIKRYRFFLRLVSFYGSLNFRGAMVNAYLKQRNSNGNGSNGQDSNAAGAGK